MTKEVRYWDVTITKDGKQIGPAWTIESKIKPTVQAKKMAEEYGPGHSYLMEEVSKEAYDARECAWVEHLINTGQI